jgi:hypothetical protein
MSEDLEQRMTHVEAHLDQLARELGRAREDAGADRESAETRQVLRGQLGLIQALRDTQLEHGNVLGGLVAQTAGNTERLDQLETGQAQIVELLAQVLARLSDA